MTITTIIGHDYILNDGDAPSIITMRAEKELDGWCILETTKETTASGTMADTEIRRYPGRTNLTVVTFMVTWSEGMSKNGFERVPAHATPSSTDFSAELPDGSIRIEALAGLSSQEITRRLTGDVGSDIGTRSSGTNAGCGPGCGHDHSSMPKITYRQPAALPVPEGLGVAGVRFFTMAQALNIVEAGHAGGHLIDDKARRMIKLARNALALLTVEVDDSYLDSVFQRALAVTKAQDDAFMKEAEAILEEEEDKDEQEADSRPKPTSLRTSLSGLADPQGSQF